MIALVLAIAVAFVAAGCGGGDKAAETETVGAGGETTIDCRADEFSGDPQLPKNFPMPGEFVVTSSTQEGPTRVVVGYWESGLDEAYREWKDRVTEAGFNVTFDELEDKDPRSHTRARARRGSSSSRIAATRKK
jgi:hypothetical protein